MTQGKSTDTDVVGNHFLDRYDTKAHATKIRSNKWDFSKLTGSYIAKETIKK